MSIYAISDLHLAKSFDKPMDIFGPRWSNYMQRLEESWKNTVKGGDYIIIPGDISWATYIEDAVDDFKFIESLPGKKIISKGNHDYWWTTMNKLQVFLEKNDFKTIEFMHNNSYKLENKYLCGTRGWKCPGDDDFKKDDKKIFDRELTRLELSLKNASSENEEIIVAMHYPPFNSKKEPSQFVEIMRQYNVKTCVYGHLHSEGIKNGVNGEFYGINFVLISADHLNFDPLKLE